MVRKRPLAIQGLIAIASSRLDSAQIGTSEEILASGKAC